VARKIKRLWKVEARVIPIIIGTLGIIPRGLEKNLRALGITKAAAAAVEVVVIIIIQ